MEIKIMSGQKINKVDTRNFKNFENMYNNVLASIQEVWDDKTRKGHNTLIITDGTTTVHIGPNMNGSRTVAEWANLTEKVGGVISDGKKMTKKVWWNITNFVIDFFGLGEEVEDVDWWEMCEESEAIGDAMCVLNDVVDKANIEIEKAEAEIDYMLQCGDYDLLSIPASTAYYVLLGVKKAANEFIHGLSEKLDCSFIMADAYGDGPYVLDAEVGPDMDVEDTFKDWLWKVIDTDDKESYIDTLFNYIAA